MSANSTSQENKITDIFSSLWSEKTSPPDVFSFLKENADLKPSIKAKICIIDQSCRWDSGTEIPVENYLNKLSDIADSIHLKQQLVINEFACSKNNQKNPSVDDFIQRFPELKETIQSILSSISQNPERTTNPTVVFDSNSATHSEGSLDVSSPASFQKNIRKIGRYRVLRILGEGGFGRVYLAEDEELHRKVAIKVPHRHRVQNPADVESYLKEARILAKLDHNGIVPIYDVIRDDEWVCYIVSKYIEGNDLATRIKKQMLTVTASAEMIAIIAETLHYAHLRGVVHRDIKPANILVDVDEKPILADFGIALHEEDYGVDAPTKGTPAYMSPEQIRGEGHLVDGRSDIFSLGAVFYEILTGRKPFVKSIAKRMQHMDVKPPRQIHDSIPLELERICLKALSNRAIERYNTAHDFASDIREYLNHSIQSEHIPEPVKELGSSVYKSTTSGNLTTYNPVSIVPKGLRSFDTEDSDFFLSLLPGPRDRNGLPENIRFWKTRIEELDPDKTFRVGLLYGPSGCGKSSMLKAGVLPNLNKTIVPIYIEASATDTEFRILKELRKQIPDLSIEEGLLEAFKSIRRIHAPQLNKKFVIIIDQFEQWLHTHSNYENDSLLNALRQCDGQFLQTIITIRDDFWMAITNFMDELETSLIPGDNLASVDLFNVKHAKKVFMAIGSAYGTLPLHSSEVSQNQKLFVKRSIQELSNNNKVIPVHLALFAEMVKDKIWEPATLKDIGGIEGVGITFLEETFNGPTANPVHRFHQKAARKVLKVLLLEKGSSIKGKKKSYEELLVSSGYQNKKKEFKVLMRILDADLKLISPIDSEAHDPSLKSSGSTNQYYHLTHDYLVPALNEWLTRKERETRKGRAQLLLSEQAGIWSNKQDENNLLSFWNWINTGLLTTRKYRISTEEIQKYFTQSTKLHIKRSLIASLAFFLLIWWGILLNSKNKSLALVDSLKTARVQDVPAIIHQIGSYRKQTTPLLLEEIKSEKSQERHKVHASLALLPIDNKQVDYLYDKMLSAEPDYFSVICNSLKYHAEIPDLTTQLIKDLNSLNNDSNMRFRAGLALADYSNSYTDEVWSNNIPFLTEYLVHTISENPGHYISWVQSSKPIQELIYPHLKRIYSDENDSKLTRFTAATILADYTRKKPEQLCELLLVATPEQHNLLLPKLDIHADSAKSHLLQFYNATLPADGSPETVRNQLEQKANAAVLLYEINYPDALWSALISKDHLDLRSYCEKRINSVNADPVPLLAKLKRTPDKIIKISILRCFATMESFHSIPKELQDQIILQAASLLEKSPDPGIHSSAEYLIRKWKRKDLYQDIFSNKQLNKISKDRNWYLNNQGQTMVIVNGPVVYQAGSPLTELDRDPSDEIQQMIQIERSFAISSKEITMGQYLKLRPEFNENDSLEIQRRYYSNDHNKRSPTNEHPVNIVNWRQAVEYCRWLSKAEGIPEDEWCYPPDLEIEIGMKLPDNFKERTGYRLPTEAEWEYACRAGSKTSYCFGTGLEFLSEYAWHHDNASTTAHPVGTRKPNNYGLFDIHGNIREWCHDVYMKDRTDAIDYHYIPLPAAHQKVEYQNAVRGGSFLSPPLEMRSANRRGNNPLKLASLTHGFRIARTVNISAE